MLRQILLLCLMTVSWWVSAQYNGLGPVTMSAPSGAANIQWYNYTASGPVAISGQTNTTYTTSTPGVYYSTDNTSVNGCASQQTVFTILIYKGTSVTLNGSTNNSGAVSYQWKNAGSNVSGGTSADLVVTIGGLYSLDITRATCGLTSNSFYVYVLEPDLTTTTSQPSPSPCSGQTSFLPVTVNNIGAAPSTGTITEVVQIPQGSTFGTFPTNNNGWVCTTSGTTATCTNSNPIAIGGNSTFSVPFNPTSSQIGSALTIPAATVSNGGESAGSASNNASSSLTTPTITACSIKLTAKVFLQGAGSLPTSPYTANADGLMRTDITSILPTTESYTSLGFSPVQSNTGSPTFTGTGNNAIVDWVLVELRSSASSSTVLVRKAGLLQKDGDIVDMDGVSPLSFDISADNYYVAVRHRNHLGAMTLNAVPLSPTPLLIDFTQTSTATYGTNAQVTIGGKNYLWAGNANVNNNVIAQGGNSDRSIVTNTVTSFASNTLGVNTYILPGYYPTDVNMDGKSVAKGLGADNTVILNIILGHPANSLAANVFIIQEQLP